MGSIPGSLNRSHELPIPFGFPIVRGLEIGIHYGHDDFEGLHFYGVRSGYLMIKNDGEPNANHCVNMMRVNYCLGIFFCVLKLVRDFIELLPAHSLD